MPLSGGGGGTPVTPPGIASGTTQAALVDRLNALVPASAGSPSDYVSLLDEALERFSQDAPMLRTIEVAIVSGVAAYNLPEDFMYMVELTGYYDSVSSLGSGGYAERYHMTGGQLVFVTPPTLATTRKMRYAARHVLVDGAYPSLTRNLARIMLIYAQYLALTEQANPSAGLGWKYSFGDEMIDKSALGKGYTDRAEAHLVNYEREIRMLNRHAGQTALLGESPARITWD